MSRVSNLKNKKPVVINLGWLECRVILVCFYKIETTEKCIFSSKKQYRVILCVYLFSPLQYFVKLQCMYFFRPILFLFLNLPLNPWPPPIFEFKRCVCVLVLEAKRGHWIPGTGVTSSCEPSNMVLEIVLWSSERARAGAISPAFYIRIFEICFSYPGCVSAVRGMIL